MVAHLAAGDMKTRLIVLFVEIKLLPVPRFWQKDLGRRAWMEGFGFESCKSAPGNVGNSKRENSFQAEDVLLTQVET